MRRFLCVCVWLAAVPFSRAQSPAPPPAAERPRTILFVGNSFTHGGSTAVHGYNAGAIVDENASRPPMGGIPGIFKKLADESGRFYEVHIELVGGKDLEYHYNHSLPVIASGRWDKVVLQGYSTEALPEDHSRNRTSFVKYARLLTKAIHEANPKTEIYLNETWPRADLVYPEGAPYQS